MLFICLGMAVILVLCIFNVIKISKNLWVAIWTLILPHSLLGVLYSFKMQPNVALSIVLTIILLFLDAFCILKFHIQPLSKRKTEDKRLNILAGGRKLLLTGIYFTLAQAAVFAFLFSYSDRLPFSTQIIVTDLIINICFAALLFINGFWRIIILSRRLNIIKKVIYALIIWIPIVNVVIILSMCHVVLTEYDHEVYKINQNQWRKETQVCKTKYPLLMLHGVGFRDLKYLNYWGRIPKELIKNGAEVYYGNQEAWGTIEANGEDIKQKILEIVNSNDADKVNIIAHSKGGLDARYAISKLGADEYVATLTTVSTPHRGSFVMDFTKKLPKRLVAFIGKNINKYFKVIGDKNPDFETASRQFYTENAVKFNEEVKDSEKVYYQSYATVMSRAHSDYILFLPFLIGRFKKQENDGLVSVESAKWGEFKGVLRTTTPRGISHGDIIDLRRHDYKGFDAREFYVKLVSELKESGY